MWLTNRFNQPKVGDTVTDPSLRAEKKALVHCSMSVLAAHHTAGDMT